MRRWFEAFNARDIEAVIALCDPRGVFISTLAVRGAAVYHGHGGMRRYFGDLAETWGDEIRLEPRRTSTSVITRSRTASRTRVDDTAARMS
jgi:SnoaL-like domain